MKPIFDKEIPTDSWTLWDTILMPTWCRKQKAKPKVYQT